MKNFDIFNKLNIPMYVCDGSWNVVFRNKACKKFVSSPRLNGSLVKYLVDGDSAEFPKKNGDIGLIGCMFKEAYKTAICFEYDGYAVVLFPAILDFDVLVNDLASVSEDRGADPLREIFDSFYNGDITEEDKFGMFEKIRRYIYSVVERYVALTSFDYNRRVHGTFGKIYSFFVSEVLNAAKKAGYRIETQLDDIDALKDSIYVDTGYFSLVLSGLLLFGLKLSCDKKCVVAPEYRGGFTRHSLRFTYKGSNKRQEGDSLKDFMADSPFEYLNVMLYDSLCRSLGWRLGYTVSNEDVLNLCIYFDTDDDTEIILRSEGSEKTFTPEAIVSDIIRKVFAFV